MIFTSHWFLLFAAAFFPVYWLVWHPWLRRVVLITACGWFHWHYAGPAGVLPIIFLGVVTYLVALSRRPWWCHAAIALNVAALAFYKYAVFLSADVLGALHAGWGVAALARVEAWKPAAPPLAISFFVFEFVHYLMEIGRGGQPLRRPDQFTLFAIFFPTLVAGPIKRYRQFSDSLDTGLKSVGLADIAAGAQRVALGFFKKLVLADNLTAMISTYQGQFAALTPAQAWLFLAALGLRILFDFSGYSDIAIGLARVAGIRIPENFNFPYLAVSLRDFWSRWHISLSTWIRDYVYIPLGGNRHGRGRQVLNAIIAFGLCGLWHGAAWHFVLWGLWHGFGLVINTSYATQFGHTGVWLAGLLKRWPALGWLPTTLFVGFGWLLFFYEPAQAWAMTLKLLSFR
ncbi:MAG TPA: MBOAT family O-acyltransferase [Lacunisphaera sp.]|jgi:alginate O-acetyltransferase complex protein AlgI|nr:MBOAT family O-acyltransferase [Lacunisphaera sp.]